MSAGWRKPLTWLGAIAFVYVGSRLPLPGVSVAQLVKHTLVPGEGPGLLGLYEMVFRGGLFHGAILGLGIMPYLAARLYLRLWRIVKPEAETTRTKTRILTTALSLIQSLGVAAFLQGFPGVVANPGPGFIARTVLTLTAASLVMMWFGERLTESDDQDDEPLSALPERPEVSKALPAPELPASPLTHPHSSSDAETLHTRR